MTQIEYILSLTPEGNDDVFWWVKSKEVLHMSDARAVYDAPGEMSVREILANSKIHKKSLASAEIVSIGLEALVSRLEKMDFQDELSCYGFASNTLSLIGNCYVAKGDRLVGCSWMPIRSRRQSQ